MADLERAAAAAAALASGCRVAGVMACRTGAGRRYLCAFEDGAGGRTWLALDDAGRPVAGRRDVRDAVSVAALCEIAAESAFPGELGELRAHLQALRERESPPGVDEAEAAAIALERVLGEPPHLATLERLDAIGSAARRLEQALDPTAPSPFAVAMQAAQAAVEELVAEVEAGYRVPLDGHGR